MSNTLSNYFEIKKTLAFNPDITVYTDGSCVGNGKKNAVAGIGVFFGYDDPRNISQKISGKQTNNTAELKAVLKAIEILYNEINNKKNILIFTDSKYVILCCTSFGKKQDLNGWTKTIKNFHLVKKIYNLFKYNKNIKIKHIKAHTGKDDLHSKGNDMADKLAFEALGLEYKEKINKIYLNVPFSQKDDAKKLGAKWDRSKKKWYVLENNKNKDDLIQKYLII